MIDAQFPGAATVGWHHTHPDLDVFLSATDKEVTRGLFNASWHVAIVIDPVRRKKGAFVRQGECQVRRILPVQNMSPIVTLLAAYRHVQALHEAGALDIARRQRKLLLEQLALAMAGPYREDLSYWIERGAYRAISPHAIRHYVAQHMLEEGELAYQDIVAIFGHASAIVIEQAYARLEAQQIP